MNKTKPTRQRRQSSNLDEDDVINGSKSKRMDINFSFLSKTGSTKWKRNNRLLAQENANLKKDKQKLMNCLSDYTMRTSNLELSWKRRGEILSKVNMKCHQAGNQIMKLVETLTELRTVCQQELSMPMHIHTTENTGSLSRFRHSIPEITAKRSRQTNSPHLPSKAQLVNHVNPMVSGHTIKRPTITLQRLNLQDVPPESPVEQMAPRVSDSDEDNIEEVDLTTIVENSESSASDSSEEEDVIEVPVDSATRRLSSTRPQMVLPVAEVPLERLSLRRISNRHNVAGRNSIPELLECNEDDVLMNETATSPHLSLSVVPENTGTQLSEMCESSRISRSVNRTHSPGVLERSPYVEELSQLEELQSNVCSNKSPSVTPTSRGSSTNRRLSSSTMRKYPSSRSKTSSEFRKSQINGVNDKCRLVVALKDVSSYIRNGTLASVEQLEEGKVKTGAIAHEELIDQIDENAADLNVSDSSTEDQTQLNFTTGFGILDYSAVPLHDNDVESSSVSPNDEFLNRIRNEDPLEGPSWRYNSDGTPTGRKRTKSSTSHVQTPKKGKFGNNLQDSVTSSVSPVMCRRNLSGISPKKRISENEKPVQVVNVDNSHDVSNTKDIETSSDLVSSSNISEIDHLEAASNESITPTKDRKKRKLYTRERSNYSEERNSSRNSTPVRNTRYKSRSRSLSRTKITTASCESLNVSEDLKPRRSSSRQSVRISRSQSRSRSQSCSRLSRKDSLKKIEKDVLEKSVRRSKTPAESKKPITKRSRSKPGGSAEHEKTRTSDTVVGETGVRPRRTAGQKNYKEPSLGKKMRRE